MKTEEKLFDAYYSLLVTKVAEMESEKWVKPWFTLKGFNPQNLRGTGYNAGNSFFLTLISEVKGFILPVFLTFNQAKECGVSVNKGAESFPVLYYTKYYKHKETKKTIKDEEFNALTIAEKGNYHSSFCMKYYNIFNIEQTNYKEVHPEKYNKYEQEFTNPDLPETNDFVCDPLDEMLLLKNWFCPIHVKHSDKAFFAYSKLNDNCQITVPLKEQFKEQESFYSTLLHEMAHSTGHCTQLNRDKSVYAKEELTAELTAAITGNFLNIFVYPSKENISYLQNWLEKMKEEPKFLFTLISAVNKASLMIMDKVHIQQEISECALA